MSVKRRVAKIKSLKASVERTVAEREDRLVQHGEDNEEFFNSLKALYEEVKAFFESRAGKKAVYLHKSLAEASCWS